MMSLGEIQQVSEGIYAYLQPDGSWYLNNTGFLVSRDGVTSVDATSTERRTRAYLEAIATVTKSPSARWSTPIIMVTTRTATTCLAGPPSSATNGAGKRSSARPCPRRPASGPRWTGGTWNRRRRS